MNTEPIDIEKECEDFSDDFFAPPLHNMRANANAVGVASSLGDFGYFKRRQQQHQHQHESYCGNCGRIGHVYKYCTEPLLSYGILCFYRGKVILVQRKHTIGYMEFLRGKYDVTEDKYITELFDIMTLNEKNLIRTLMNFDALRLNLGMVRSSIAQHAEYKDAETKFNTILASGKLVKILDSCQNTWLETEWGIPKGRRNLKESDIACAMREFGEETGIDNKLITVYNNVVPLEEDYIGMNGINYHHTYFIAYINDAYGLNVQNQRHLEQSDEINSVQLMTLDEATRAIRPYYNNKIATIKKAFQIISGIHIYFES